MGVVLLLSFANGANDNLTGVATLLGSGTANYRKALWWATASTLFGSVTAAWFAVDLLETFFGKGLVADVSNDGLWPIPLVGACMAAGGILCGQRVAATMSQRITAMNQGQGFTANALSGVIVIVASGMGLPVSTTHVMCGSLFGIGVASGRGRWGTIGSIACAWLVTLPCGMLLGALSFLVTAGQIHGEPVWLSHAIGHCIR